MQSKAPERIDITTETFAKAPAPWIKIHDGKNLGAAERRSVDGIHVTAPERTLLDLASQVDPADLEEALESTIRRGLTTFARLDAYVTSNSGPGRRGCSALRRLLKDRGNQKPTESPFETLFHQLLRRATLPPPERQHPIFDGGRFICRVDFAWPSAKVAIEADSWQYHFGHEAWQNDSRKGTAISALGWTLLRFTYQDLKERPGWVIESIEKALSSRLF